MEKEIKVKDLFLIIKKSFWIMTLITIVMTAAGGFYGVYHTRAIYQSSTQLIIPLDKPDYLKTMEDILKNPMVLDQVVEKLGLNRSSDALSGQVSFVSKDGSDIVQITVQDSNPLLAAKIANTTTNVFIQQIGNILGIYNSKILSEAKAAKTPLPTNQAKNLEIGFAIGIVLSLGFVFLLDSLNDSVTSEHEIERLLGLPVLGAVSKMKTKNISAKNKKQSSTLKGGTIRA